MNITKNKNWYKIKRLIPRQSFESLLEVYYYINRLGYLGKNVYCPICESHHRKFDSGSCPKCGAGERHRTVWVFLMKKTDFFTSKLNVLHFAPEHCFYKRMKKLGNLNYLSADIDSPRAMVEIDMTNIQYPDNYFDVLLSSHVLEHVEDDLKAMSELYRVQKNNGWAIHLAPIDYSRTETFEDPSIKSPEERAKAFGHFDHKRKYGTDYGKRLESVGFVVEVFKAEDFCDEKEIELMGLKNRNEIYYCKKNTGLG